MHILLRFQATLPEWVFISSADRAEQADSVLLSVFLARSGMSIKTDGKFFFIVSCYVWWVGNSLCCC